MISAVTEGVAGWPLQLSVAVPFVGALAFIGKWLLGRTDALEKDKKDLYDKIINDLLDTVRSSTTAAEQILEQYKSMTTERVEMAQNSASLLAKYQELVSLQQDVVAYQEELRKREISALRSARRTGGE